MVFRYLPPEIGFINDKITVGNRVAINWVIQDLKNLRFPVFKFCVMLNQTYTFWGCPVDEKVADILN